MVQIKISPVQIKISPIPVNGAGDFFFYSFFCFSFFLDRLIQHRNFETQFEIQSATKRNIFFLKITKRNTIKNSKQKPRNKPCSGISGNCFFGGPGGIRTPDPRLRRPLLYPTGLLDRSVFAKAFNLPAGVITGVIYFQQSAVAKFYHLWRLLKLTRYYNIIEYDLQYQKERLEIKPGNRFPSTPFWAR